MTSEAVFGGIIWIAGFVILIGLVQNIIYTLQLLLAWRSLFTRSVITDKASIWTKLSDATMPVSILAPAFNEEASIVQSVRSLLALQYPNFRIVVINDGSKDQTLDRLISNFDLEPFDFDHTDDIPHAPVRGVYRSKMHSKLLVIDKENGGKADALNAGISVIRTPLFCAMDSDSILEADSLLRAVEPFIDNPDKVVAVGGTIRLANGCTIKSGRVETIGLPRNLIALFQVIEYLRAFLIGRLSLSHLDSLMIISGAFGIIRRSAAIAVGGYSRDTVGEDMELIVKIHRDMREKGKDYSIIFVPEPVCWTEAPETLSVLSRQRRRWQRGTLETFFKHGTMLFNPRYGRSCMVGFLIILISDVIAPLVEFAGYLLMPVFYFMDVLSLDFFLAYMGVTFIYGIFLSVGALVLEEMELKRFPKVSHLLILGLTAILENFGYRQLNNYWRIVAWFEFIGKKKDWGVMTRRGLSKP